jgi:hypothetical protein
VPIVYGFMGSKSDGGIRDARRMSANIGGLKTGIDKMKNLKASALVFALALNLAACSGDNAEKAASGAVSKAVELAKGAATGVGKGVDEGRKASTSADGALIVSNGKELSAALSGEVLTAVSGDSIAVTMAFANAGEAPVRVTELSINNHVTALDADDFACSTQSVTDEFTVPAKAKLKVDMQFNCDGKSIAKVRLYDIEYVVTKDRVSKAK